MTVRPRKSSDPLTNAELAQALEQVSINPTIRTDRENRALIRQGASRILDLEAALHMAGQMYKATQDKLVDL